MGNTDGSAGEVPARVGGAEGCEVEFLLRVKQGDLAVQPGRGDGAGLGNNRTGANADSGVRALAAEGTAGPLGLGERDG